MKNVKCARCVRCGKEYEAVPNLTNCSCGGILDIIYDYDYIKAHFTKETLKNRVNPTMWRYRELLPVEETTPDTPLRVGWSPLYEEPRLAALLGLKKLWVKDDGINPTASLKDRASAMAVAKAQEAGAKIIACSSTGNAASSLAGNAAAAGLKTYIFVPERAPKGKVAQLMIFGANVISVKGNYEETFKMSAEAIDKWGWYNRNAAINPYLSEGKKTVSLEIAEQLNWEMPDYLAISVGDGCTIAGVWKGLKDLYAIGFIDKLPRLISAQSTGCYPINRAIQENKPWEPMEENTIADSISVGVPRNADKALMAIRESNGIAVNVTAEEQAEARRAEKIPEIVHGRGENAAFRLRLPQPLLRRSRLRPFGADFPAQRVQPLHGLEIVPMEADALHDAQRLAVRGLETDDETVRNGKDLALDSVGQQQPPDAVLHAEGLRTAHGQLIAQPRRQICQKIIVHPSLRSASRRPPDGGPCVFSPVYHIWKRKQERCAPAGMGLKMQPGGPGCMMDLKSGAFAGITRR